RPKRKQMLAIVGIPVYHYHKHPGCFSGGQRQRMGIARAVVNRPAFLLCVVPTSALIVSNHAQNIQLQLALQKEFSM
ncbi:ATP-binding cassette domain-containing protein, partial [Enterococcus faecium]|uniref:ATP-binding cassette domain-containing protein n=1 Tax=Enterococcus faecium TaxID=1352 RepID=UPI003CC6B5CE